MPRINLTISEDLLQALQEAAKKNLLPINLVAVETLEKVHIKQAIDYSNIIQQLIAEIDELPRDKTEFCLNDLKTYAEIEQFQEIDGEIKPTALRPRIGRAFNEVERTVGIKGVKRAYTIDKHGNRTLKFEHRAAVYTVDWSVRNSQ